MSEELRRLQNQSDAEGRRRDEITDAIEQSFLLAREAPKIEQLLSAQECEIAHAFLAAMRSVPKAKKQQLTSGEYLHKSRRAGSLRQGYISRWVRRFWEGHGWQIGSVNQPVIVENSIRTLKQDLYLCEDSRLRSASWLSRPGWKNGHTFEKVAAIRTLDRGDLWLGGGYGNETPLAEILLGHMQQVDARI